jgi:hypothetical protein
MGCFGCQDLAKSAFDLAKTIKSILYSESLYPYGSGPSIFIKVMTAKCNMHFVHIAFIDSA